MGSDRPELRNARLLKGDAVGDERVVTFVDRTRSVMQHPAAVQRETTGLHPTSLGVYPSLLSISRTHGMILPARHAVADAIRADYFNESRPNISVT